MTDLRYAGGAAATTLASGITNASTTITLTDASSWPSGGAFTMVLERGLAGEEKILIGSRSGNTLTVTTRGYDGTSAAAHNTGVAAEHCLTATAQQEFNDHQKASAAVHGLTGTVVGTSDSQTLTSKTVNLASNTLTGTTAQFNTALSDGDFTTLAGVETVTNKRVDDNVTFSSASMTIAASDRTIIFQGSTASQTITITAAVSGRRLKVYNDNTTNVTLSASGCSFINTQSATTVTLTPGSYAEFQGYGSNWLAEIHSGLYTPTWGASGTQPAIGNGSVNGQYVRSGDMVRGQIVLTPGSTTTFGTGYWTFSLPFVPSGFQTGSKNVLGRASAYQNSSGNLYLRDLVTEAGALVIARSEAAIVGQLDPFTWANSDKLTLEFTFWV